MAGQRHAAEGRMDMCAFVCTCAPSRPLHIQTSTHLLPCCRLSTEREAVAALKGDTAILKKALLAR